MRELPTAVLCTCRGYIYTCKGEEEQVYVRYMKRGGIMPLVKHGKS